VVARAAVSSAKDAGGLKSGCGGELVVLAAGDALWLAGAVVGAGGEPEWARSVGCSRASAPGAVALRGPALVASSTSRDAVGEGFCMLGRSFRRVLAERLLQKQVGGYGEG